MKKKNSSKMDENESFVILRIWLELLAGKDL